MARTKRKSGKPQRIAKAAPAAQEAAASPPVLSVQDLLVNSARLIASLNYDGAKQLCIEACEKASEEAQNGGDVRLLRDALEILGTVELELGEVEEAREVSRLGFLSLSEDHAAQMSSRRRLAPLSTLSHRSNSLQHFRIRLRLLTCTSRNSRRRHRSPSHTSRTRSPSSKPSWNRLKSSSSEVTAAPGPRMISRTKGNSGGAQAGRSSA